MGQDCVALACALEPHPFSVDVSKPVAIRQAVSPAWRIRDRQAMTMDHPGRSQITPEKAMLLANLILIADLKNRLFTERLLMGKEELSQASFPQ